MAGLRIDLAVMFGTVTICLAPPLSLADPANWLPSGSSIDPGPPPDEWLTNNIPLKGKPLLGKLLFNSPSLLGEKAVRIGLSCNSCHPNGHVNTRFYMNGLSDAPGTVDVTHSFWESGTDDGSFNPIQIPSLRGVSHTAPYGTLKTLPTLDAFTRHVISTEFAGPSIQPSELSALLTYMNLLESTRSQDMSEHDETTLSDHFSLLLEPLKNEDTESAQRVGGLIREELGRRAISTPAAHSKLSRMARDLKVIQNLILKKPSVALKATQDFISNLD